MVRSAKHETFKPPPEPPNMHEYKMANVLALFKKLHWILVEKYGRNQPPPEKSS